MLLQLLDGPITTHLKAAPNGIRSNNSKPDDEIQENAAGQFPETDLKTGFSPIGVLARTT
jgi:hypothetical protein